jgi:hypothetical protein
LVGKIRARVRRENGIVCAIRPAIAGAEARRAGQKGFHMPKRNYPGRLTREQWLALPRAKRHDMARRGQCDVLGSFRLCTNKRCRRARTCSGDSIACLQRLWLLQKKKPKTLRRRYDKFVALLDG